MLAKFFAFVGGKLLDLGLGLTTAALNGFLGEFDGHVDTPLDFAAGLNQGIVYGLAEAGGLLIKPSFSFFHLFLECAITSVKLLLLLLSTQQQLLQANGGGVSAIHQWCQRALKARLHFSNLGVDGCGSSALQTLVDTLGHLDDGLADVFFELVLPTSGEFLTVGLETVNMG